MSSGPWQSFDLFNPTEEHAMLRKTVREFVRSEVEPQAAEYDRKESFNLPLFRRLGELGIFSASPFPTSTAAREWTAWLP